MNTTTAVPRRYFWQRQPRPKPPPPLDASFKDAPGRWLLNKALVVLTGLAFVHVGTLIVVALYYLAFETIPGVKYDWDHLLTGGLHLWGAHVHLKPLSAAHWLCDRCRCCAPDSARSGARARARGLVLLSV